MDIANRYLLDSDVDEGLSEPEAIRRILLLRDRLVQFALQHNQPEIAAMFEALRAALGRGHDPDALTPCPRSSNLAKAIRKPNTRFRCGSNQAWRAG
ncbi:hypothetical protein ACU4GD_14590 [Cupriavidus basilensis]